MHVSEIFIEITIRKIYIFCHEKSFFLWFLSNLRVKSRITKVIDNNIFKGLNFRFEFVTFDLKNNLFFENLNFYLMIFRQNVMWNPQTY